MRLSKWTTAAHPSADRFDAWADALSATHLDWQLVGRMADFRAEIVARRVDDLRLVGCNCDPCEGARSKSQISRSDDDCIGILFELAGSEIVRQGNREATLKPGDFVIWDSSQAMEFRVLEPLRKMTILAPKATMRRFLPGIDDIAGMRIDGTSSLGPLVGAYLHQLFEGISTLEDDHLHMIAGTTLELVAAGVGAQTRATSEGGTELFERVRSYILKRLDDPQLAPPGIAEANGISLRYLHKLFSSRGLSVSRWILKQRLERCRRTLELEGATRSITDVALGWGFNDLSHFSRSYRAEFGSSPRSTRGSKRALPENFEPAGDRSR